VWGGVGVGGGGDDATSWADRTAMSEGSLWEPAPPPTPLLPPTPNTHSSVTFGFLLAIYLLTHKTGEALLPYCYPST